MSTPNDGGPAFPLQSIGPDFMPGHCGMSLRDWFAGQAISGGLIDPGVDTDKIGLYAYQIADSMLAEREKGPQ